MKYLFTFLALIAFLAQSQAQVERCGAHTMEARLWEKNPELETAYMEMRNNAATQNVTKGNQVYTIPIVTWYMNMAMKTYLMSRFTDKWRFLMKTSEN